MKSLHLEIIILVEATYFDDYNQLPNLGYSFQLSKDYVEGVIRNFEDGSTASILKSHVRKTHHDLNKTNDIPVSNSCQLNIMKHMRNH